MIIYHAYERHPITGLVVPELLPVEHSGLMRASPVGGANV